MAKSLSLDIRKRVVALFEEGFSCHTIGRRLCISASSAVRITQKHRAGVSLEPSKWGRKPGSGRLEVFSGFLRQTIEAKPDMTMPELSDALFQSHGLHADPAELSRFLRHRLGFTYKKRAIRNGEATQRRTRQTLRMAASSDASDAGRAS